MANTSRFVWYELMTTDTKAAETFYRGVLGWQAQDAGLPDRSYTILSTNTASVGGLMALPETRCDAHKGPGWIGYIAADVDAAAAAIAQDGGAIHRPAEDIPGTGRFAIVADPQGAVFALFQGADGRSAPPTPLGGTPGHVGWNELMAADGEAAFGFYARHFGWTKADAVDMGPMGVYQIFAIDGAQAGGMMTKPPHLAAPVWNYYFNVDDIDAAVARVKAGGGEIPKQPMQVPGGSWIAHGTDPQGASFALVGPRV